MSVPAAETGQEAQSPGPATGVAAPDSRVAPPQATSAEQPEQTERGIDYFRQAFMRTRPYTQSAAPAVASGAAPTPGPASSQPAPQTPPVSARPAPTPEAAPAPPGGMPSTTLPPARQAPAQARPPQATPPPQAQPITLSPQDLERRVQAETDRRLAKQQRDQQEQLAQERERELRRTDPRGYVELLEAREREQAEHREQMQRLTGHLHEQLSLYDRSILDVFVGAVPEKARERVISKLEGIDGRKATAEQTLKALRSVFVAEGRASARQELMKDQAFVKEILARYGGQSLESTAPPVAVPAPRATSTSLNGDADEMNQSVNAWMRSAAHQVRQTTGR